MIRRALIHVAGPAGSGKTTFIGALLRGLDEPIICVSAQRDDTLRAPRESAPKAHVELRRYADAGAVGVARYRFPARHADPDDFFLTDFMLDYATAVVIEGDCPLESVDLEVFVASPPAAGSSLLVRVQRDQSARRAASLDDWERALASRESLARLMTRDFGEPLFRAAMADPALLHRTRAGMKAELRKLRAAPPPKPTEHWAVAPGYEGIERAGLVVVSARDEDQEERCAGLIGEISRLRRDEAVFKDILGIRGARIPITAVVARLDRPKDPGLKKALARVKRAIRSAS